MRSPKKLQIAGSGDAAMQQLKARCEARAIYIDYLFM